MPSGIHVVIHYSKYNKPKWNNLQEKKKKTLFVISITYDSFLLTQETANIWGCSDITASIASDLMTQIFLEVIG